MKTPMTQADIEASISALNSKYNSADKAGRRSLIASDAIAQIRAEKYSPCHTWAITDERINQATMHSSVSCDVCGLGALFISTVRARGGFDMSWVDTESVLGREGFKEFSITQRKLIELAYERGEGAVSEYGDASHLRMPKKRDEAIKFGQRFDDDTERMLAIFQNIVDNGGEFIPEILTMPPPEPVAEAVEAMTYVEEGQRQATCPHRHELQPA